MALPSVFLSKTEADARNMKCSIDEGKVKRPCRFETTSYNDDANRRGTYMPCNEVVTPTNKQEIRLPGIVSCVANKNITKQVTGSLKLPRVGKNKSFLVASSNVGENFIS